MSDSTWKENYSFTTYSLIWPAAILYALSSKEKFVYIFYRSHIHQKWSNDEEKHSNGT